MIELSDLIGFGYDLSDTKDGLKCWRMGIVFCGKHPLLLTRIQVSNPVSMGPLVVFNLRLPCAGSFKPTLIVNASLYSLKTDLQTDHRSVYTRLLG